MNKKITAICLSFSLMLAAAMPAFAGGALETVDLTGNIPSPIAGHIIGRLIPIKWDTRALPVRYSMNTSLGPNIPNPLPPATPVLTLAQAQTQLQASLDRWNNISTSYIDMQITGTTAKITTAGFDFINELTFRTAAGFAAIASSPSTTLIRDVTLVNGDLIDGDADSDVSNLITTVQDVDSDGDLEFPAGFYKAGTILDNDVQFNTKVTNGLRFTVGDAALDTTTRSVDLDCVATHEFGHSFGLSHTLENQYSATDGNGTTMYPFIDTGDPASEASQRSPESDDIAWASYFYQEGSDVAGPPALQSGDAAFSSVYGLITGELRHGVLNQPIAGGSVAAYDRQAKRFVASAFSGTTQVSRLGNSNFVISPAFNILDGKYTIPVPKGNYELVIEPVDGQPVPAGSISLTAQIGSIFGQHNFNEEYYNNNLENVLEVRPGEGKNIPISPGKTKSGNDITTNRTININNFGSRDFIGFTGQAAGSYYVVRIPASQVSAVNPGQPILFHSGLFDVNLLDASVIPLFAEAMLATGSVSPDGSTATIDLVNPLAHSPGFIGQDGDFAPFYFKNPHDLGEVVRNGIAGGSITDLFLVLRLPTTTPFPGVTGAPPLIGLDGSGTATGLPNDIPIQLRSYLSTNGVTFT